jgi:hypothetical protein
LNKIAHIINPFKAAPSSDLFVAQPITFASMQHAKKLAQKEVEVTLFTAQFEEDLDMVPKDFVATRNLERSVLDMHHFEKKMKLPLIQDILNELYEASDADYFIYTNVDIGLYPNFYSKVNSFIDKGLDAFIINRRRLPEVVGGENNLDDIFQVKGKKHPGFDCFVFKRSLFPQFQLENICIGVPFIGITLAQNIFALAEKYAIFTNEVLTFHLGEEVYKKRAPKEYFKYNQKEFWKVINGPLQDSLSYKKLPYYELSRLKRIFKYSLHPCFPIRLILKLEKKG